MTDTQETIEITRLASRYDAKQLAFLWNRALSGALWYSAFFAFVAGAAASFVVRSVMRWTLGSGMPRLVGVEVRHVMVAFAVIITSAALVSLRLSRAKMERRRLGMAIALWRKQQGGTPDTD